MEEIVVDKDIVDFLRGIYFGSYSNKFIAACSRAYRDMNRTIRFKDIDNSKREELRIIVYAYLEQEITGLEIGNQDEFDSWHYKVCDHIRTLYRDVGVGLTYGQCQKWVNMTFKYLYIIGEIVNPSYFDYLHIPLDNYVFDVVCKEFNQQKPKIPWSRWDDYAEQYLAYQKMIRENVNEIPLRWEFKFWLKEARNM